MKKHPLLLVTAVAVLALAVSSARATPFTLTGSGANVLFNSGGNVLSVSGSLDVSGSVSYFSPGVSIATALSTGTFSIDYTYTGTGVFSTFTGPADVTYTFEVPNVSPGSAPSNVTAAVLGNIGTPDQELYNTPPPLDASGVVLYLSGYSCTGGQCSSAPDFLNDYVWFNWSGGDLDAHYYNSAGTSETPNFAEWTNVDLSIEPEPSPLVLLGTGLLGVGLLLFRRNRATRVGTLA